MPPDAAGSSARPCSSGPSSPTTMPRSSGPTSTPAATARPLLLNRAIELLPARLRDAPEGLLTRPEPRHRRSVPFQGSDSLYCLEAIRKAGSALEFPRNRSSHPHRHMPPHPSMRKPYKSDLTDDQWALIEPLIPPAQAGRPAPRGRHAGGAQHPALPGPHRLPVGLAAARPAAQEHRLRLLPAVARRRHLAADRRRPAPEGPGGRGPRPDAAGRLHRQPDGQGRPRSAASGATTAARRSAAGSGTSSSTRWGCCWSWWSRRPRPTTGRRPRGAGATGPAAVPPAGGGLGRREVPQPRPGRLAGAGPGAGSGSRW